MKIAVNGAMQGEQMLMIMLMIVITQHQGIQNAMC